MLLEPNEDIRPSKGGEQNIFYNGVETSMRSHIGWRGEQNILYNCVETSVRSHIGWKGEQHISYKGGETSPW